ncbi:MAG: hypothetical protein WBQ72_15270 [Terriglobales bacterium]
MEAILAIFLIGSTAIVSVVLGVLGAYYAVCGVLAAFNSERKSHLLPQLIPNPTQASGD